MTSGPEPRFFELDFDVYVPGRWYLAEPTLPSGQEVEDIWAFTEGRHVDVRERLRIPLSRPGQPLDFDKTTVAGTPIISEPCAAVFRALAPKDVQLLPVEVEGQRASFFLLNVVRIVSCIDDAACAEARRWTSEDGRPDLVGTYHVVAELRIDVSQVGEARVFRPWGYCPPILVAGEIKDALEREGLVGALFRDVTAPRRA